ncbi:hypothetical protein EGH24_05370 [Halonotius terrestris]|uniref:Transmembrane glycoprotein / HTH domain protein n=1 Tax=Halonotius terrestris TaxID=2487750 RepID=A0A8J8PAM9_9EURY|nr:hypothetical protein [Halonotius terrestris]TQQ82870.1 hypothetical protein EGH24_05370 [Halonotius terrestris]
MRAVALSAILLVLLGAFAVPGAAALPASGVAQTDGPSSATALAGDNVSEPATTMDVRLQPDRSAEWTVTVEYTLDSETAQAAFDDLAATYEEGTADAGPDAALYRNIADLAGERTDRDMAIEDVNYAAMREGSTGRLRLSFTWTEFLGSSGDGDDEQLVFNDALRTPSGDSWLTTLEANQTLRIHTPRGYAITSANVAFSDNTVEIEGPRTFQPDDHIRIVYDESVFGAGSARFLGVAVIIASLIVGTAVLLRRTDSVNVRETVLPSAEESGNGAAAEPAATPDQPAEPASEPAEEDLSLLADDERVERLLERNGGRMRQADIVAETDWSDAKVSQLLSSMADEDRISKLRIGRENLITLPDVDAAGGDADADSAGDDDEADAAGDADTDSRDRS